MDYTDASVPTKFDRMRASIRQRQSRQIKPPSHAERTAHYHLKTKAYKKSCKQALPHILPKGKELHDIEYERDMGLVQPDRNQREGLTGMIPPLLTSPRAHTDMDALHPPSKYFQDLRRHMTETVGSNYTMASISHPFQGRTYTQVLCNILQHCNKMWLNNR